MHVCTFKTGLGGKKTFQINCSIVADSQGKTDFFVVVVSAFIDCTDIQYRHTTLLALGCYELPSLSKMPVGSMEKLQLCVLEADTDCGVQGQLEEHFMAIVVDWMDLCKLGSSLG